MSAEGEIEMRTMLIVTMLLAVSPALIAGEPHASRKFAAPQMADAVYDEAQYRRAVDLMVATQSGGVHFEVSEEHSDWFLVFPIVGSTPGGNGTFFRSETTLVNNLTRTQRVAVFYFPVGGGSCSAGSLKFLTLDPFSWYLYPDVVSNLFGASGLGGMILIAVDAAGNPDSSASLDGFSRIWTPVPGFGGTASQSFPPVIPNVVNGYQEAYGLRQDAGFRTNVGVFNYAPTGSLAPRLFDVNIYGFNGVNTNFTLTVSPCSLVLQPIPAGTFGNLIMRVTPRDGGSAWYGFGSSVDNISGDNWSSTTRR
jgi:hypothetical protein